MGSCGDRKRTTVSAGSSSSHLQKRGENGIKCYCSLRAVIRVSGTEKNPGRLFYGCPRIKVDERCQYFSWVDKHNGGEDKFMHEEATSTIPSAACEAEAWRKNVTNKLSQIDSEIRRLNLFMMLICFVMFSGITFLLGYGMRA